MRTATRTELADDLSGRELRLKLSDEVRECLPIEQEIHDPVKLAFKPRIIMNVASGEMVKVGQRGIPRLRARLLASSNRHLPEFAVSHWTPYELDMSSV